MAMGNRGRGQQESLFVPTSDLARSPGHPFYDRLNKILAEEGFDPFVEEQCAGFYAKRMGRPSIPPGVYFRFLMVGYFEGISSERAIAWRCADSRSLATFLGYGPTERTPDHSTLSRTRRLIDVETHRKVFGWILDVLARRGLVKGRTVAIDGSTLEANAAMRSIVRRDDGRSYDEFLEGLAKESGIESPTREQKAKLDKKRPKKGRNDEWEHPHDPDARITKMKDGRTHEAHKIEHATDLDTHAIVGVTIQPADRGDTTSVYETLHEANEHIKNVAPPGTDEIREVVLDKGYHSNAVLRDMTTMGFRTYISEPDRGRRRWAGKEAERDAVYANRRRIRGNRGQQLRKLRGEIVERAFAHCLETGGGRRLHVRRRENVEKRSLIGAAVHNLSLLMRSLTGFGTPKALQGVSAAAMASVWTLVEVLRRFWAAIKSTASNSLRIRDPISAPHYGRPRTFLAPFFGLRSEQATFTTGC